MLQPTNLNRSYSEKIAKEQSQKWYDEYKSGIIISDWYSKLFDKTLQTIKGVKEKKEECRESY